MSPAGTQRPALDRRFGLLAYLCFVDDGSDRDRLAALFWPEVPSAHARTNLRSLLARARRLPYASGVITSSDRVTWHVESDARTFRRAIERQAWEAAVAVYGGELLAGAFDDIGDLGVWVAEARERLRGDFRRATLARCDALHLPRKHDAAVPLLERLLADDPFDEEVVRHAARALAAAGQRGQALRVLRTFRERLAVEVGATPMEATERRSASVVAALRAPEGDRDVAHGTLPST